MDPSILEFLSAPVAGFEVDALLKDVQDSIHEEALVSINGNGLDEQIAPLSHEDDSYAQTLYNITKNVTGTYEEDEDGLENPEIFLDSPMEKSLEFLWDYPVSLGQDEDQGPHQNVDTSSFQTIQRELGRSKVDIKEKELSESNNGSAALSRKSKSTKVSKDTLSVGSFTGDEILLEQILRGFEGDFGTASNSVPQSGGPKRGRPENQIDVGSRALEKLFKEWRNDFKKKLMADQRSDARTATVVRFIKKIPDVFLKYIGSKCQYKSKEIYKVVRAYLKSFVQGFIYHVGKEDYPNMLELFLHYITLCFPDSKVTTILKILKNQASISEDDYKTLIDHLKIRKSASKNSFQKLYRANCCLRTICSSNLVKMPNLSPKDRVQVANIIKSLGA